MKSVATTLINLFFIVSFFIQSARSEEVTIYNVPLSVDSYEPVGENSVKIIINGQAQIVSTARVPSLVLAHAYSSGDLAKLNLGVLEMMHKAALEMRDNESSLIILKALLNEHNSSIDQLENIFSLTAKEPRGRHVLEQLWAEKAALMPVLSQASLLFALLRSGELLNVSLVPGSTLESVVRAKCEEQIKITLQQGGSCTELVESFSKAFSSNVDFAKHLQAGCELGEQALLAQKELNLEELRSLNGEAQTDPFFATLVEPLLVDVAHKKAQQAVSEVRYEDALLILADVSRNKITPTTLELIEKTFKSLESVMLLLENQEVRSFVEYTLQKSESLQVSYLYLIRTFATKALQKGNWPLFESIMPLITNSVAELDPKAVSNLWVEAAMKSIQIKDRQRAENYFNKPAAKPTFLQKVSFNNSYYHLAYFEFALLLVVIFLLLRSNLTRGTTTAAASLINRKVYFSGLSAEESLELNKGLTFLGLKKDATESEMKSAFREAVKKAHPDHAGADKDSDDFIRLTKMYDRTLELMQKRTFAS